MSAPLARAVLHLALCCLAEDRRDWGLAMRAEFDAAAADGAALGFACGCLVAAMREMVTREAGWFTLTNYALALGIMLPMAALQIGCALFGLPYLYPAHAGLTGALLEGAEHEPLIRGIYQAAIPSLTLLLAIAGIGHLRLAWAMLERDWPKVWRRGTLALAASLTLTLLMAVLFLDNVQALRQVLVLGVELASLAVLARWRPPAAPHPG